MAKDPRAKLVPVGTEDIAGVNLYEVSYSFRQLNHKTPVADLLIVFYWTLQYILLLFSLWLRREGVMYLILVIFATFVVNMYLQNIEILYRLLFESMLSNLQELGCNKSIKIHILHSHLDRYRQNLGDFSEPA